MYCRYPLSSFACLLNKRIFDCRFSCKQIVFIKLHGGHICVQNNEIAVMSVYHKSPMGMKLFSHVKTFFCSNIFVELLTTCSSPESFIHV